MKTHGWLLLGALLSAGCGDDGAAPPQPQPQPQPDPDTPGEPEEPGPGPEGPTVQEFTVYPVVWSRADADVGTVASVVDGGETVVVLGSKGAVVLEHGEVASTDPTKTEWRSAAVIPAGDGTEGHWTLGIDAGGGVYRVQPRVAIERISARYGLDEEVVLSATTAGGKTVFGLEEGVAVADGEMVKQYATTPFASLAGGTDGRIAMAGSDTVQAFDLNAEQILVFDVPGAAYVTFDAEGRLLAGTATSLYKENADGALALLYEVEEGAESIHGLVTSGDRVWLALGAELGVVDADAILRTKGLGLATDAQLIGAASGDVWALAGGKLLRFSADESHGQEEQGWEEQVGPIVARACSQCHLPGGPAAIDLSTYATWVSRRAAIYQRVVVERNMPPPGFEFAEADRDVIRAWIEGGR